MDEQREFEYIVNYIVKDLKKHIDKIAWYITVKKRIKANLTKE